MEVVGLLRDGNVLDYYRGVVSEMVEDLALYKRPRDIRLIPTSPRTISGRSTGRKSHHSRRR